MKAANSVVLTGDVAAGTESSCSLSQQLKLFSEISFPSFPMFPALVFVVSDGGMIGEPSGNDPEFPSVCPPLLSCLPADGDAGEGGFGATVV